MPPNPNPANSLINFFDAEAGVNEIGADIGIVDPGD